MFIAPAVIRPAVRIGTHLSDFCAVLAGNRKNCILQRVSVFIRFYDGHASVDLCSHAFDGELLLSSLMGRNVYVQNNIFTAFDIREALRNEIIIGTVQFCIPIERCAVRRRPSVTASPDSSLGNIEELAV